MIFYHVAPREARESILKEGLHGDPDGWDKILWAWDKFESAQAYARGDDDIYEIRNQDNAEPGTNPHDSLGGYAWALDAPVLPKDFKRL